MTTENITGSFRRRTRLAAALLAVTPLVLTMLAGCTVGRQLKATASPQPNILFVLTDDLDVTAMAHLPVIRRELTKRGVSFRHFYVSDSLCCPSRVSILRGQYVHNHHVVHNAPPQGGYRRFITEGEEGSTVATWMHHAGYRTGFYGKYLNAYPLAKDTTHVPPGWDDWHAAYGVRAYRQFDYNTVDNGHRTHHAHRASDYGVDVVARQAAAFVTAQRTNPAPLFLYVAPYSPHAPATAAPRYTRALPNLRAPRDRSFNQADVSRAAPWVRALPRLTPAQVRAIDRAYRRRLRSMLAVQDLLVRLLNAFRATGRLANTYVFFTSDNGYHLGQHRLTPGKRTAFETDIRVPMIVRGPGVPAGRTTPALASNIDLAPTFAALARAPRPTFVDGRSLLPLLHGRTPPTWRHAVLTDYQKNRPPRTGNLPLGSALPSFHAVRTTRYTYVEHPSAPRELYDNQHDPHQLTNRYRTADHQTARRLHRLLHRLLNCSGSTCRNP